MKVAIYGQVLQEHDVVHVHSLLDALKEEGAFIAIEKEFLALLNSHTKIGAFPSFTQENGLDSSFDLFVSFGGDGTMLRAITYIGHLRIPIVGVNTGRLGFLSTFKKEDVRKLVTEFVAGNFTLEERSLVEICTDSNIGEFGELNFALNEITVSRKDTTSMITVETFLNDEYLTSYWADGLIVSTPTGSTGYSLSCGGPVMAPTAKSLVLTPIAPHNLNARPFVISDDTKIRLKVSGREEHHLVSLDSRIATIPNGKEIIIQKSPFTINMVVYTSESFLKTLRNKLLWGEDRRN
ncbi:NAD kinase [Muricauda sp. SCSIO 64092]|uniref:NAD kinase n=1 Tax=Allomuricauda sp. SCSIO 64092 TaxID=2908842 RepID=UPI001FF284C2|nr:NAD kinase [Muricauda sp. SCSIO 64092]UOY07680.1 NAD kinase [Muricauda sp. SCSIO 64092]